MKLFPGSPQEKCGLLNLLNQNNISSSPTIYIPNNKHGTGNDEANTVINCSYDSEWASTDNDPSLFISIYKYRISPAYVSITRRNNASYPKQSIFQGLVNDGWIDICNITLDLVNESEIKIIECGRSSYFSTFRLFQVESSRQDLKYIEMYNFDIFGYIKYDHSTFIHCSATNKFAYAAMFCFLGTY